MEKIKKLSEHLLEAYETGKGVAPLTELEPELNITDAYGIQLDFVDKKLADGRTIVGKKVGLTSKAMQESLGVDEPDYGHLFDDMVIEENPGKLTKDQVIQPRVEGELAFILKEDLQGPNVTIEDVLQATDYITAAIEIVDSRVADWKIKLEDTVADNGSSAYYLLGDTQFKPEELDRIGVEMQLYQNDELINEGNGAAVLGDPAYCVAWLANKLSEFGITLKSGEVILAGALSAAITANPGDVFTCKFSEGLGDVTIEFED